MQFFEFLSNYCPDRNGVFVYRDQLRSNVRRHHRWVTVSMDDLITWNEDLAQLLVDKPSTYIPMFEKAAARCVSDEEGFDQGDKPGDDAGATAQDVQIMLCSNSSPISIRALTAQHISQLVKIHGIVVSASRVQPHVVQLYLRCRSCGHETVLHTQGTAPPQIPRLCPSREDKKCALDSLVPIPDKCVFMDKQTMKLQESPESIPTGELPRTIVVSAERGLVGRVVPGTRVSITGVYTASNPSRQQRNQAGAANVTMPFLRVTHFAVEAGAGRSTPVFKPKDEAEFRSIARRPDLHQLLLNSTAPAIYGLTDVKRALLCQLFGGSPKVLPDHMKLRGDINILMLGDPGTAKSQLLKFVEGAAPIGVYTSGKGSSAAGLTASVTRDPHSKEFYLEGGAMVLADGGIVCIDEFDKMDTNDRVAIHEAMEQQTISIAKAGITTILNARTAVLAAANPVFGRYDDMRTAGENIDFQTTILSRFDMIFLVKDKRNERQDRLIAEHVMRIHTEEGYAVSSAGAEGDASGPQLNMSQLKRYISYCKSKCSPRITREASEKLQDYFVNIRASTRHQMLTASKRKPVIPVTIRQLEAIVRISESLAKMELLPAAGVQHVTEAIRLFEASTVDALNSGAVSTPESMGQSGVQEVRTAEEIIKRDVLPIGSTVSEHFLVASLSKRGIKTVAAHTAIDIMVKRDELEYRRQRKSVFRKR
eukprot:TRINITY_DN9836_c0_g1_i1.p1 TRINITY_DN9836_c0_g1~~TRINITY_DN9836_c0_g1_i1.p1  ORF type:complete len:754 (+),score=168.26 TRINITY_DN9836_c0_g1_i1:144-2264(+)